MKKCELIIAALFCVAVSSNPLSAETAQSKCQKWNAKVDPGVAGRIVVNVSELSDNEVVAAMECLLKNRGKRETARIYGATHFDVSQTLPPATIELASLYYISYLFTGNYQHGDGIALWDDHGVINPPGSIDHAYDAYKGWFKRVKTLGLVAAKKQHLDPLKGTNLKWYGK